VKASNIDSQDLTQWIGREIGLKDTITGTTAHRMARLLDLPDELSGGDSLPLPWHWAYLLDAAPQSQLGADGHARRGSFLPPVALPRRMWAGSSITLHSPLCIGDEAVRKSRIDNIQTKSGRSGDLVFVTVHHCYYVENELRLEENQDIVYRDHSEYTVVVPDAKNKKTADFTIDYKLDITALFRYSALTFNAHRIHYDHEYVTKEEGYPGLIVHGPLLATLLLQGLRDEAGVNNVRKFQFRAKSPVFVDQVFSVRGAQTDSADTWEIWIENADGVVCMAATAYLTST